jgi:hypothetical protein
LAHAAAEARWLTKVELVRGITAGHSPPIPVFRANPRPDTFMSYIPHIVTQGPGFEGL